MILFDTETTGLVEPYARPLKDQPYIIEFAAIKLKDKAPYKMIDSITFLVKPPIPIPEIITKITGLTDKNLEPESSFSHYYPYLVDFFLGEQYLIGHNVKFDVDLLRFALMRMDKLLEFPWPPVHICTVVQSMNIKGHRLKQEQLLEHVTGTFRSGMHRAMADVEDLRTIVAWMLRNGMITL